MALERYGLGATATLDSANFVQGSDRARDSLGRFIKTSEFGNSAISGIGKTVSQAAAQMKLGAQQIATGANQLNTGVRNAAIGLLPLTVAIGSGVQKAAAFEKQMSAVGSITRANETDMMKLNKEAKRMGIVSVFSATQAGEGMEYLARAGANADQIIAALQGTMNAAAADSIDLATASDIVAQIVKGMGKDWGEAAHVADVLALTSASANTNIVGLGESFKYGVAQANALGISLEETSAIFGKLADAGLKGSTAGTSFTMMMNKLVKPSEKSEELMKKWGISLNNADGTLRKVSDIVQDFSRQIEKIPNASDKAAVASELFGIRGAKAYSALAMAGKESLDTLEDSLIAASSGVGAATEMAATRLDNFLGKLTLFGASVESISIGIFGPLLKSFTPAIEEITNGLNNVLFSLEGLNEAKQRENVENAQSAQLIAREAANRLKTAGAIDQYRNSSLGALQVLSRMAIGEEKLSSTQIESRKRALQSSFEVETKRRAEMIKTQQLEAAGVANVSQLSNARKDFMMRQINEMTKARKDETNKAINLAFSGASGAIDAQKWLRSEVLKEALASSEKISDVEKQAALQEINSMIELEAAASKKADSIRAQIFGIEKLKEIEEKYGSTALQIALGLQDAVDSLIEIWDSLTAKVKELGGTLEEYFGKDGIRKIAKYATMFGIIAGAMVPLILGFNVIGFAVKNFAQSILGLKNIALGVFNIIRGGAIALVGSFWPLVAVSAAVALAFALIRKDGESIGDTLSRVWNGIKKTMLHVYHNVIIPFIQGFSQKWNELVGGVVDKWRSTWNSITKKVSEVVNKIKSKFNKIFGSWFDGIARMEIKWENVGGAIAKGFAYVAELIANAVEFVVTTFMNLIDVVWDYLEGPITALKAAADAIISKWDTMKGSIVELWTTVKTVFTQVASEVGTLINEIVTIFSDAANTIGLDWQTVGTFIGYFITSMVQQAITVAKVVLTALGKLISGVVRMITNVIQNVKIVFKDLIGGINQILDADFLGGLRRIGIAIFNALTYPFRTAFKLIMQLVRKLPGVDEMAKKAGIDLGAIQDVLDKGITSKEVQAEINNRTKIGAQASQNVEAMKKQKQADISITKTPLGAELPSDLMKVAESINDLKAQEKRRQAETPKVEANINLEDKRTLDIKNSMCVEGENMNVATARHKQEIQDRAGFKSTPWQRRTMLEHGAAPMNRQAG